MSRLVDADALKERFQSLAYDDWNQGVITSWADAYRECADMVDEMPTIEPERKTGRWINGKCSNCGGHAPYWPMASTYYQSNFCPHCGAKMEVEHHGCD